VCAKTVQIFFLGAVLTALSACASYQSKTEDFRNMIRGGQAATAAEKVKEQAFKDGDDQVVYLLEYATAQQLAKNFDESNKAFLKAEELTDIKDYHSISRIGGSLLLNEGMVQYKGDDFEKVLINAMLAINFLEQKKLDEAQVECRKLNDKLYKFRYEGKKNYDQNPFAFYLSALIWEANKNWDSAYIDFKKAYDLNSSIPYLKEDLIRAATQAQRPEDLAKWKKQFGNIKPADLKEQGEVVLIYQQGWGPKKQAHPNFPKIPKLYPSYSSTTAARLEVEKGPSEDSQMVSNITDVAIKTLDDQYAGLVAKRVGGIVVKEVAADQIRQKNELLGAAAWIALHVADQADLRQWTTLPASFQVAKIRLRPGNYRVRVVGLAGNSPSGEESPWMDIKVDKRKKTFVNWRSLR
jgi:hypothetical protein